MGIKFKGIHSDTIPAVWKTIRRPILPTPKTYSVSLPEADSEYDFSEFNEDGRLHYNDRVIEGTLTVVSTGMYGLQKTLTRLAKWLIGGCGELEFDDMPGTVWTAKIENVEQVQYELGKAGIATVYFRTKPFSKLTLDSETGGILLNSSTPIEANLPLELNINQSYNFSNGTILKYENYGDWYTKPIFTLAGTYGYVEFQCNGKTFRYNGGSASGQTVIIDCNKYITTKNGVNDSIKTVGNYFEFVPGTNEIKILTNGTGQISIKTNFNYIYGVV